MATKIYFLEARLRESQVIQRSGEVKMANPIDIAKARPAETAMPLATVLAALVCRLLGVEDTDTILYLALVLSFVPAVVTWIVDLVRKDSGGTTYVPPSNTS